MTSDKQIEKRFRRHIEYKQMIGARGCEKVGCTICGDKIALEIKKGKRRSLK